MSRRDDVDIDGNVETYLGARVDTARYSAFDYCFNYFRDFHDTRNVAALTDVPVPTPVIRLFVLALPPSRYWRLGPCLTRDAV